LTERKDDLETLAQGLLEYETLSGDEIINLLKGIKPVRDDGSNQKPAGPSSALPTIGKKSGGTAIEPTLA
jgi:cell division protease FtsH